MPLDKNPRMAGQVKQKIIKVRVIGRNPTVFFFLKC